MAGTLFEGGFMKNPMGLLCRLFKFTQNCDRNALESVTGINWNMQKWGLTGAWQLNPCFSWACGQPSCLSPKLLFDNTQNLDCKKML